MHQALETVLLLLAAAVAVVTLCRRAQLPAMLGYLLVGIAIGPHAFGLIASSAQASELAEYGVVFLMFSLGLEFSLPKLTAMRRTVFGLGSAQVGSAMLVVMAASLLFGLPWQVGLVLGGILAMSSTAIVTKLLAERVEVNAPHGQQAIGVLLFQDLAVVPLLIITPALGSAGIDLWMALEYAALKIAITLVVLLYFGPKLLRPLLHLVAKGRSTELFVLNVLLVTLGISYATAQAGLSLALGAFLAGMLIAETEYRHQVEEDIRPFRDLLLGLFFITVGMRLDLKAVWQNCFAVLMVFAFLTVGKTGLITGLVRWFGCSTGTAVRTGLALGQGGEFGFVLLTLAAASGVMPRAVEQVALASILLSMLAAPFLIQQSERIVRRFIASDWMLQAMHLTQLAAKTMATSDHVILCGYGRSGQALARVLQQEDVTIYALDLDPERVKEAAAAGENVSFGDATRREVLMSAGLTRARALIVTYDHTPSALKILNIVRQERPDLPVIVRTRDDNDIEKLREAGADGVVAEIMEGSLMLASHALMLLGVPLNRVLRHIRDAREQRYSLFRGFFRGISDEGLEEQAQPRLHSIQLNLGAAAIGKTLADLKLVEVDVSVRSLRQGGRRLDEPPPEHLLQVGDVLVLLGTPDALARAERRLLG
ncbi:monovalent cation:proton antiporter family protein [Chitinimonas sp. BJB300]|uniref:monovalent cation:proton antiporter family protein n=1 Tax=Chitinimonas sp. BJB300 TaxID=1559339 RepID=UPI000C11EEC6|nr:monovalent cation:proton antiporter family protein [Chitinimonas sp. BJB300]PHV10653.1 potassium transporter [Chitinimonas sp. BJB300]TSJ90875.1 potassium transporter [Chitinimonas sp. BJB300]